MGGPDLPARPCLKPWYRVAQTDGRLILEYGQGKVVLEGRAVDKLFPVLLPLVDGTRTVEEISQSLGDGARPAVTNALSTLAEQGLLMDGPALPSGVPSPSAQTAKYLAATGADGRSVAEAGDALDRVSAAVVGSGPLAEETARQLGHAGLSSPPLLDWGPGPGDLEGLELVVVAPDPSELPKLQDWNRLAIRIRQPWLQVLPFDGRIAVVGPLYVPDETCCYECYRRRRRANLRWDQGDEEALELSPAAFPAPPPLQGLLAGCAAMAALDWLYRRSGGEQATVWSAVAHVLSWDQGIEIGRHHVYRVPRCPECFPDDLGTASPWHS